MRISLREQRGLKFKRQCADVIPARVPTVIKTPLCLAESMVGPPLHIYC